MRRPFQVTTLLLVTGAGLALASCGETAKLPLSAGIGPHPQLPSPKPDDSHGLRGFITRRIMARAGAGVLSANRLVLLRDTRGKGVADTRTVFLEGLNSPYGIALVGDQLFVADTDAIRKYTYRGGQTRIDDPGSILTELPAGRINHHWTKNLVASPDGRFLYVSIGSNSNVGENGLIAEEGRAQIWEVDARTGEHRSFATGLRNPNGLSFAPGPTNGHSRAYSPPTLVTHRRAAQDSQVPSP